MQAQPGLHQCQCLCQQHATMLLRVAVPSALCASYLAKGNIICCTSCSPRLLPHPLPAGIIGTNLVDAEQTVDTMLQTRDSFPEVQAAQPGAAGLRALLQGRGVKMVSFAGWQRVDGEEVRRGEAQGKPRDKLTSVEEMLLIAAAA